LHALATATELAPQAQDIYPDNDASALGYVPYLAPDRATLEGRAALPGISLALNDYGPDEVPDLTPRPLDELLAWAERANEYRDQGQYWLAGRDLGTLLTELQHHALTAGPADRPRAFKALVQSCILAGDVAKGLAGNIDLAVAAARRGYEMACRHGEPGLIGFAQVVVVAAPDVADRSWPCIAVAHHGD
jgi:hypothetical protein